MDTAVNQSGRFDVSTVYYRRTACQLWGKHIMDQECEINPKSQLHIEEWKWKASIILFIYLHLEPVRCHPSMYAWVKGMWIMQIQICSTSTVKALNKEKLSNVLNYICVKSMTGDKLKTSTIWHSWYWKHILQRVLHQEFFICSTYCNCINRVRYKLTYYF